MRIRMVGIDHSKASLDYREAFSFTKAGVCEAVKEIKSKFGVKGCILLSTCNRTELWISQCEKKVQLNRETRGADTLEISPYQMLCMVKGIDSNLYEEYFVERENEQAVEHLLKVVCGFDSKIFGEDQIISQVRGALQQSRDCECADMALEKVFQTALSAGKRVRTEVHINTINHSSANETLHILKSALGELKGKRCLVIGNGQMGKLVANALIAQGAKVSMTLRKKMHGNDKQDSIMPDGCTMIGYEERIRAVQEHQIIISATLSPHYTLRFEEVEDFMREPKAGGLSEVDAKCYLFDLAVPRDIDPRIGKLPYVELFDIDSMNSGTEGVGENKEQLQRALNILEEYRQELNRWFAFRSYVPKIQEILDLVTEDTVQRFVNRQEVIETAEPPVVEAAEEASRKAASKLLYGLREKLTPELWAQCIEALYQSASRQTLKH